MVKAKELIYDEARNTTGHGNALRIIEDLYGYGYVSEFYKRDYETDAWENGRGKGAYRTKAYNGTEIEASEVKQKLPLLRYAEEVVSFYCKYYQ